MVEARIMKCLPFAVDFTREVTGVVGSTLDVPF